MKIIDALAQAELSMESAELYFGHGTDNAWDEACVLMMHALGREDLPEELARQELQPNALANFEGLVTRRVQTRQPAAYLTGIAWFAGQTWEISSDVLVPRSPIAELILKDYEPWLDNTPARVLDLCCGSGCIGLATAMQFEQAEVWLSDISAKALDIASKNQSRHGLQGRTHLIRSDLFDQIGPQKFDLIVSNPPYVDAEDLANMPAEFHHEPRLGLEAGEDGLILVRRMLAQVSEFLTQAGVFVCEVGNSAAALEQLYPTVPFTWIEFEYGGEGVFVLRRDELDAFRDVFCDAYNAGSSSETAAKRTP